GEAELLQAEVGLGLRLVNTSGVHGGVGIPELEATSIPIPDLETVVGSSTTVDGDQVGETVTVHVYDFVTGFEGRCVAGQVRDHPTDGVVDGKLRRNWDGCREST